MHTKKLSVVLALASVVACSANSDNTGDSATAASATSADGQATAMMTDSTGKDLGTLTLSDTPEGIMVMGTLTGVPDGEHAIHLHTTGACTPNFAAAGGHWNPTNKEHGKDSPNGPHLGDTPNITVSGGSISVMVTSPGGTLRGDNALLDADGAAVVIHAKADDYKSQPAGAAGDRIACGVVK